MSGFGAPVTRSVDRLTLAFLCVSIVHMNFDKIELASRDSPSSG